MSKSKKKENLDEIILDLERVVTLLDEEGWYVKANKVDNAIRKIRELKNE